MRIALKRVDFLELHNVILLTNLVYCERGCYPLPVPKQTSFAAPPATIRQPKQACAPPGRLILCTGRVNNRLNPPRFPQQGLGSDAGRTAAEKPLFAALPLQQLRDHDVEVDGLIGCRVL